MGRHSRSAAAGSATVDDPAASGTRRRNRAHGKGRGSTPLRTGLLGVSAAVAVGAVAMASGLLPGGDTYTVGGSGGSDQVRADGVPDLQTQGGSSATPASDTPPAPAGPATARAHAPSASPSAHKPKAPAVPSQRKKSAPASPSTAPARTAAPGATPRHTESAHTEAATSAESSAAAAVLSLVNQQRAQAGCRPVRADTGLASLAGAFSAEMASRGFFDHTDPDGATPWDRADKAGVKGLGGENIARGQADAAAVMDSWMHSPGHRANILNCDFTTLGVGVHFGPGGPWWTQDFGY
ncbi:CAP domain-containing protein [Streptomyces sp. NBC_01306]|uniref:CAP domain-containing protein n=1 Tax=Streptomyces sp. NBC_01306 TaxID=2903819 RepID=UPI00225BB973|nr:CAP domain-containing protein [Streptomyces sp. NBC_01306]MCX4723480.1 CAP domain-containing protein [Streptomyces sp. NBC_01306]